MHTATLLAAAAALAVPLDKHDMCVSWAESGECEANPSFMQTECATACASGAKYAGQVRKECEGYAKMGECSRNPAFMLSSCKADCAKWEAEHGLRLDTDASCVTWSLLGECEKNPKDMWAKCNTSCTVAERCARSSFSGWSVGICDKALRCEALDAWPNCAELAAAGKCRTDATRMVQKCLRTCSAIDVDGVLSAQRPEMRARISEHIDIPPALTRAHSRCWLHGWADHNSHKQMLPTQCSAKPPPWRRRAKVASGSVAPERDDMLTCPIDVSKLTPRVPVHTRRVSIAPHTPHEVTVVHVSPSPRVRLLHDFITAEEADALIKMADPHFMRSPVRSVATERRTSMTATLGFSRGGEHREVLSTVRARIAAFSGYDEPMLEPLQATEPQWTHIDRPRGLISTCASQVVRYHPGEKYDPHHDLFDLCDFPQKPRRHVTFLIYLNDLCEGCGGHTTFPRLGGMRIAPRKHTALVFNDVLDNGLDDERTEHGGSPPNEGVKYAVNCWIRAGNRRPV